MTRAWTLVLVTAFYLGIQGVSVAIAQSYTTHPQENVLPPPELESLNPTEKSDTPTAITSPNEQPLWDLLARRDFVTLRQQIDPLRRRFPLWQPPTQLQKLLTQGEIENRITTAIDDQDDVEIIRLQSKHGEHFGCNHIVHAWAAIDSHLRLRNVASAQTQYNQLLSTCTNPADWIATLHHAASHLDIHSFDVLLLSKQTWPTTLRDQSQTQDVIIQNQISMITALYPDQPSPALTRLAAISPMILQRRRSGPARQLGWLFYQSNEYTEAAFWFRQSMQWNGDEESVYGLTLTLLRQGDLSSARTAAHDMRWASQRMRELYRDILSELALQAHNLAEYGTSAALFAEAEQYSSLGKDLQHARAWNAYQLNRFTDAAQLFVPLYLEQRDEDSARGTYFSLRKSRQDDMLRRLVDTTAGPLSTLYRTEQGLSLLFAKRYRAAIASGTLLSPSLINLDSPQMTMAGMWRQREGDNGLSKLRIWHAPILTGSMQHGSHLWGLQIGRIHLDSGTLPTDALIGNVPLLPRPFDFSVDTDLDAGNEWQADYTYLGDLEWHVAIGDTAWLSPLEAGPLYSIGVIRQEQTRWSVTARRENVRDSMLSYIGQRDPYSGVVWGGVTESGLDFTLSTHVSPQWSAATEVSHTRLRAEHVPINKSTKIRLELSKTISRRNNAQLHVGPYLEHHEYDQNLSLFTFGHGGYFSPQNLNGFGLASLYTTADSRRHMMKAQLDVGYQKFEEEAVPYFPLAPDGRMYRHTEDTHTLVRLTVKSVMKLTPHWLLGGAASYLDAPSARDSSLGLFITYSLKPRGGVIDSDIPKMMFEGIY